MMTRKDYVATAKILSNFSLGIDALVFEDLCDEFAEMFEADNPKFDTARFLEACHTIGGND